MPPRRTLSPRWVAAIMAAALVCSVAVVWSLIQLTGGTSASSSTPAGPASADASGAASGSTPASTPPSGLPSPGTGVPQPNGPPSGSSVSPSASQWLSSAVSTPPASLPDSGLPLPAAWTGTAELTVTVLGRCAEAGGTSSYTRAAELALQPPATGSGAIGDPNPLSLTLGITPAGVPGLSIYSAAADGDGTVRRTWWLAAGDTSSAPSSRVSSSPAASPTSSAPGPTSPDPSSPDLSSHAPSSPAPSSTAPSSPDPSARTELSGVLIDDQPVDGVLPPNVLIDNETDLQPCEASGAVRVPRILAAGSTLTGWVSATAGRLDLTATTTDGERAVKAAITLSRRVGT